MDIQYDQVCKEIGNLYLQSRKKEQELRLENLHLSNQVSELEGINERLSQELIKAQGNDNAKPHQGKTDS